jgi:signal transduction histidine kinase/ActR/RegA family two-component response regulator
MSSPSAQLWTRNEEPRLVVRRDGTVLAVSTAFERLSGWSAAAAVGRRLNQLITPLEPLELPDLASLAEDGAFEGVIGLGGREQVLPSSALLKLRVAETGAEILAAVAPLPSFAGKDPSAAPASVSPSGPLGHRTAQMLRATLERMPGFTYTVDKNLVFTTSAGGGLAGLNLVESQVVGMSLLDMWGTKDPSYEPLACHLRALAGIPGTYQDVCLGRSLEYQLRPLRDLDGAVVGVIGVGFDVTERELAREEQAKLTAQLRQAQRLEAIGRLAGGVAHDFNNLLTCIMGNLTLAEGQVAPSSKLAHFLTGASAAAESAATLTRQLLAFGRKQVIDPRPVNLSALIERVKGMLERLIGESITLRTKTAADLWHVHADPGQLEQVLVNLVANARDAITGHGEIVVETENYELLPGSAEHHGLRPGRYALLSVRDTGRGMSDVVRSRLFEPFFTTKETGAGTGLGLATVYGAVQQNGGTVTVDSKLGEGSVFRIYLPMVQVEIGSSAGPESGSPASSPRSHGGTETILLVEDEPLVLELARCTLEQLGYNVLPCSSPDEALRTFGEYQNRVGLLVTDVVMPRMNGKELASRVRSLQPNIAVLFSSGYGEDIIAKQGVLDQGLDFIGKPYRPSELGAKVRAILDRKLTRGGTTDPNRAAS